MANKIERREEKLSQDRDKKGCVEIGMIVM